eukprot:11185236-Lingulodinium_polyedra.AAC.1
MTGIPGFVNHHRGIMWRPNAKLIWCPEVSLGEHSLKLVIIKRVEANQEITISYGPLFIISKGGTPQPRQKPRVRGRAKAAAWANGPPTATAE